MVYKGEDITRRQFLKGGVGAGIGLFVMGSSTPGNILIQDQSTPCSHLNYRNGGAIIGLKMSADEGIVQGTGAYFVGSGHVEDYETLSRDIPVAKNEYRENIKHVFPEGSQFGPAPIRLWQPTAKKNTFVLSRVINRG